MSHHCLTFHVLWQTKMLRSFQESPTLRCEIMFNALAWSLEIGTWPVCRKETWVNFILWHIRYKYGCVPLVKHVPMHILCKSHIHSHLSTNYLRQTFMVNPLVFTRFTFLVSFVNTAFVNAVIGNLQEWCDLVSQDCDCHFSPNIF